MVEWLCRILLAGALFSAAGGKVRRWDQFRSYLATALPLRTPTLAVRVLAGSVLCSEAVLATLIATGVSGSVGPLLVVAFLTAASGFTSAQLVRHGPTECPCWGVTLTGATVFDERGPLGPEAPTRVVKTMLHPLNSALRNGLLCVLALLILPKPGTSVDSSWVLYTAALFPAAVTALGMTTSIGVEAFRLRSHLHPRYGQLAPYLAPLVVLDYYR